MRRPTVQHAQDQWRNMLLLARKAWTQVMIRERKREGRFTPAAPYRETFPNSSISHTAHCNHPSEPAEDLKLKRENAQKDTRLISVEDPRSSYLPHQLPNPRSTGVRSREGEKLYTVLWTKQVKSEPQLPPPMAPRCYWGSQEVVRRYSKDPWGSYKVFFETEILYSWNLKEV